MGNKRSNTGAIIDCIRCGHRATIKARAADLMGKTLVCSRCGQRQRVEERREVRLPGFRKEGDVWILMLANEQRRVFESDAAAWRWLEQQAAASSVGARLAH